jgi:hypothetical protein
MAFDFSECLDYMTDGKSTFVLNSVIYTSLLISILIVGIMYLIFHEYLPTDRKYVKMFLYSFLCTLTLLSVHYSSVHNEFDMKYEKHKLDEISDTTDKIPEDIINANNF